MADNLPAVATEIATIEADLRSPSSDYWRDEGKQARYRDLLTARDGGGPAPAAPSPSTARRRELEAMMADSHSPYWKGQSAGELQSEYLALAGGSPADRGSSAPAVLPAPGKPAAESAHQGLVAASADEAVANLQRDPHGARLVASWGKEARANAGYAIRQSFSILNSLSLRGATEILIAMAKLSDKDNAALMDALGDAGRARETR